MRTESINGESAIEALALATENLARQLASTPPCVSRLEDNPIPKHDAIVETIELLRRVLFPGYRQDDARISHDIREFLHLQLTVLHNRLTDQIARSMVLDDCVAAKSCDEVRFDDLANLKPSDAVFQQAQTTSTQFLNRLPDVRQKLAMDIQAAYDGDPACKNLFEVVLCYPGLHAVTVYRLAHELYNLKVPFLPRMMSEWAHVQTGIDVHPGANISEHFFIDHGTGVVIGETCVIGRHVKLYQGVTLGALSFPQDQRGRLVRHTKRHPTIQDNVVIYANATVLGGDTIIGHDSVIGSSVWLTHSVDPFTTVIMEKPNLRIRSETPGEFEPPVNYQI